MKRTLIILLISIFTKICFAQSSMLKSDELSINNINNTIDNKTLDFYRQHSIYTDPEKFEYLYEGLSNSLPELCSLVKSQIIHPYTELPKYRELLPKERWNEAFQYPSVKLILKGLVTYDSLGLVKNRKPEARLVLGCNQNAIMLASILKFQGTPARVRYGHANYIIPGFHISHTICEVWNEDEKRWILVDPSMDMVDFDRSKFDFSNDLWIQMQNGEIDPNLYGIPRRYTGLVSIVGKICTDMASILGTEFPIDQYAPILDYVFADNQIPDEHKETLNRVCELMKSINADNLSELQEIYDNNPIIQITKSFTKK